MSKRDTRGPMVKAIEAIAGRMLSNLGDDHHVGLLLQAEVKRLYAKAEALDSVNARRSPLETPAAHAMKVAKMARTFNSEITATINRAGQVWSTGFKDVERRISEKVDLRPDAFASEIRTAFRGMHGKARAALIKQLVEENRGPELAAIVKAPSILSGIGDQERQNYEKMIVARHAGAEVDEIAKLEDVFSAVSAAAGAAESMVKDFTNPAKLAEIEREAAASEAAGVAFSQSFSDG